MVMRRGVTLEVWPERFIRGLREAKRHRPGLGERVMTRSADASRNVGHETGRSTLRRWLPPHRTKVVDGEARPWGGTGPSRAPCEAFRGHEQSVVARPDRSFYKGRNSVATKGVDAMRTMIIALLAGPLVAAAAVPAIAQSNPSTNQIIQSLKPSGNLLQGGTRGIRLAAPSSSGSGARSAPAAAPHAIHSAAAAAPTQAEAAAPSVNLNVDFPTNSATLTPDAKATLDRLGRALTSKDLASYRFRIEGHTDTVGSPAYNQALSQRRADAVAAYLEQAFSIQSSRLEAVGMGEQGLLVVTPPQTAELRNRRVAVINLGA
jgi:OmpA-OmpF porin, OOP family